MVKIAKKTKQLVVKNFIIPTVGFFVAKYPEFSPHWLLLQGFFGSLFDLQQERVNDFVEYLKNNIDVFTKKVVETKDFQEGFVITFENYLKQRNEIKRKLIQNIFLGFSQSKNKTNFELERMYDLLNKMSGVDFLVLNKIASKSLIFENDERNERDGYYNSALYLQSLGLLNVEKKQSIEDMNISTKKNNDEYGGYTSTAEPFLDERETFSLSDFGIDFVGFIEK